MKAAASTRMIPARAHVRFRQVQSRPAVTLACESAENAAASGENGPTCSRVDRRIQIGNCPAGIVKENVWHACDKCMKSSRKRTPARHGLGTAEAALGRVDRVGVGEHTEVVSGREVHLIARYRENASKLRVRNAKTRSRRSTTNTPFMFSYDEECDNWVH